MPKNNSKYRKAERRRSVDIREDIQKVNALREELRNAQASNDWELASTITWKLEALSHD